MASFDQDFEYDPQPDLDVDSWISNIESDNEVLHTPMTVDHDGDEEHSPSSPRLSTSPEASIKRASSIDINLKPLALRSCRAATARSKRYILTPDSSDDDSSMSDYHPSPKVQPVRRRRGRQASSEERSMTPPLIDVKSEPVSPLSSVRSGSIKGQGKSEAKPKAKPKYKKGGGRKGEPRRSQNMIAQKKYRDKRVKAAHLVSETIVELRIGLESAESVTHTDCLALIEDLITRYRVELGKLDPTLSAKQDLAVMNGLVKEEK